MLKSVGVKSRAAQNNIIVMFAVFLMVYRASNYNRAVSSGAVSIIITLLCGLSVIVIRGKNKIDKQLLLSVITLCSCVLVTSLFTGDDLNNIITMISSILISTLFVVGLSFDEYCRVYTRVMSIIAIYSLFVYLLSNIAPFFIRLFPSTYSRLGYETYNLGLSFVNLGSDLIRNMGIFWEPGAYQTYLVLAILIELFVYSKSRKNILFIYFISLLTTFSTTGIIAGLTLLLIWVIDNNVTSSFRLPKIAMAVFIMAIAIIYIYSILPPAIQYAAVDKITIFLNSDKANTTGGLVSAAVRFNSIIYPINALLTSSSVSSPIIGLGYDGLKQSVSVTGFTMTTATPINWFAMYGVL